jgi:hypothetical protein
LSNKSICLRMVNTGLLMSIKLNLLIPFYLKPLSLRDIYRVLKIPL